MDAVVDGFQGEVAPCVDRVFFDGLVSRGSKVLVPSRVSVCKQTKDAVLECQLLFFSVGRSRVFGLVGVNAARKGFPHFLVVGAPLDPRARLVVVAYGVPAGSSAQVPLYIPILSAYAFIKLGIRPPTRTGPSSLPSTR